MNVAILVDVDTISAGTKQKKLNKFTDTDYT